MRRVVFLLLVVPTLCLLSSCAREPLKQAGIQGENAISTVRDLTNAYERKDIDAFMEKISPSFSDRDGLRKAVEKVALTYQTIQFRIQYSRMLIMVHDKGIKVAYTWEGEWRTAGGKIIKDGAQSTLALDNKTFAVTGIEGKNPFLPVESSLPIRQ